MIDNKAVQETANRIVLQTPLMRLIDEAIATTNRDKILGVAGEISKATTSQTPCKNGCSHCCYMAVMITDFEAKKIAEFTKTDYVSQTLDILKVVEKADETVLKYASVPCTFLGASGECTIYPVRPLGCRLHHNLNADESNCKMSLPLENMETTPSLNLNEISFWFANLSLRNKEAFADIREYFPKYQSTQQIKD